MASGLVRAILPRRVVFGGVSYEVRPPTVREAVTLLTVAQDAMAGDEDAWQLALHVLRSWYPSSLLLASRNAERRQVISYALQMMQQGSPEGKKREGATPSIDWDDIISLYMHTYGQSLDRVLNEPWPGFLIMASQIGRIEARGKLNLIQAQGLPYIKSKTERTKAFNQLRRMAGIVEAPKKVTPEEAQKNLNDLAQAFASFGALA